MENTKSKYLDELLIKKVQEMIIRIDRGMEKGFTDFLDPRQQILITQCFVKNHDVKLEFYGGYEEAERRICGVFSEWNEPAKELFPISIIHICWKSPKGISHRDILGSILGNGIKRDKVGDIIQQGQEAYVCVHKDVAEYLIMYMDKVGNVSVKLNYCESMPVFYKEDKILSTVVASLRLDCILAAGFGVSRTKAVDAIKSTRVFVNWMPQVSASKEIKEGDIVSWRGKGRIQLCSIVGSTKKDRIKVEIKKYI